MKYVNRVKRLPSLTLQGFTQPFYHAYLNRQLLLFLLKRDINIRTSNTVFGDAWLLLQPALQALGFWFLLGMVLKVRFPSGVSFVDYFLVGMLPWLFISEVLGRTLNVLEEFGSLYRRAVFPIVILPLVPLILSAGLYAVVFSFISAISLDLSAALIAPLVIFSVAVWLIPICYLLAVLGLFLKDIGQFFPFLITFTLYLSPILYTPELMPEQMRWILMLNPIADMMALIHAVLQDLAWTWGNVARLLGVWLALLAPAWLLFKRAEPHVRELL